MSSAATTPPVAPSTVLFQRKQRDRSCLVSADAVMPQYRQGKVTLVDVRIPESFDRYRIPGSLNIPWQAVKTKSFLKTASVVLLDEGHVSATLGAACTELKHAGFTRVAILDGGLHAWQERHGPLIGDAVAQQELGRLEPQELLAERAYADWLVLDFSRNKQYQQSALRKWLPADVEPVKARGDGAVAAIRAVVAKRRHGVSGLRVLVVSDTGADYDTISHWVAKAGVKDVLYLDSGLSGYSGYVSKQLAMWDQENKPRKLPSCRG